MDTKSKEFEKALQQASEEFKLQSYYRACVRPLFAMPMTQWPLCCGSQCEPCSQTLVSVAARVCELLRIDASTLPECVEIVCT